MSGGVWRVGRDHMKLVKIAGLAALAAMALMAFVGAGTASAGNGVG